MPTRRTTCAVAVLAGWLAGWLIAWPLAAGEADVVEARLIPEGGGRFTAEVTVRHADTGWDHYADRWEVLGPHGTPLGTRTLHHPHVEEQPFTRSLRGIAIPADVQRVTIRAHDSVHGFGGAQLEVPVPH